ncbi:YHYH protein [Thalassococcus sp. S3]|uniref:YHYH protein n=1 Tax=Thalassococcus sp. S3 TaxID=2017482 RepID=UPI00102448AC|nr:YHYH protein [Thalassococcus sp. S3]QBF33290.1 YHYH protein [Thalassococcus sp. S3]
MIRTFACVASALMWPIAALSHENVSHTFIVDDRTCITSNGVPNHEMGRFPNRANPNAFRAQNLKFCFPTNPQRADTITTGLMTVGVTLTGVPLRPYTAGYYDPNGRNGIGDNPASGWRQQAMHAPRRLGMDTQDAHVDRSGLYHYHAVSDIYAASTNGSHIGYAPDGFEIHYDPGNATSSWHLKPGTRPSPPYGVHDGQFEEDFEYRSGSGTLDECNGMDVDGTYTYFATDTYPYFPRCFKGTMSGQFMVRE